MSRVWLHHPHSLRLRELARRAVRRTITQWPLKDHSRARIVPLQRVVRGGRAPEPCQQQASAHPRQSVSIAPDPGALRLDQERAKTVPHPPTLHGGERRSPHGCMGRGRSVQASPGAYRRGPCHEEPQLCSHCERPQSCPVQMPQAGGGGDKARSEKCPLMEAARDDARGGLVVGLPHVPGQHGDVGR
jgi:hypothetical protein